MTMEVRGIGRKAAMPTAHDVAAYILKNCGTMSAMKLQKLVYYCQAWSLVWDERPMFPEPIEAWANGPVVFDLYDKHCGQFEIREWPWGNPDNLDQQAKETVDAVTAFYGRRSAQWLSDLTHQEDPWQQAREDAELGQSSRAVISLASMAEYYGSLS